MIIDAHCHAGTGDGFTGPWDTEAKIEPHLERAAAAGIDRTIVFPVFNSDYAAANRRLAAIVARHPRQLIGFAGLNPQRDAGRIARLVGRAVESYGFRGIKIHGAEATPTRETCVAAERWGLPILYDPYRQAMRVEMLASQHPNVNFVIPHLGSFTEDWPTFLIVIGQLRRFSNVYADTSGVRYWDAIRCAVQAAGPNKIIFGSDGPQLHPAVELMKIRVLGLPPAKERLITGGNIARLLAGASRRQLEGESL